MNTKLKSALAVIFVTLMLVALVACGSQPTPTTPPEHTATAETVAPTPDPGPDPTATTAPVEPTPTPTPEATATPVPVVPTPIPTPEPTATPTPMPTEPVEPETEVEEPLDFDPMVVRGTLSNGLSYYIRHNEEPRERAQIALAVKAGSVLEEENQRGLAHLVEHMAFNGTERFAKQEIIEYIESIGSTFGPDLNAYTGFDETLYFLEIPTDDPEITENAFQILSDWAYAISFDPEEVELERGVVLEEWRLSQGFNSRLQDNLLSLLFGSSRYADRAPIGLTEIIENAPVESLIDYYERWYRPDLMAVVAVGDFDIVEMEAKVKQHFAPSPEGEAYQERAAVAPYTERPTFDVPSYDETRIEVFTDSESPGSQFILIRNLAPDKGQDLSAFRRYVVESLAFMMLDARLFERTQSADPPYLWAGSGRSAYVESLDILTFQAWVEPDGIETGLGAVLEEMQRVRQHGFTESELAREKSNLLSSIESAYKQREQTSSGALVDEYVAHFFSGTPVPGIEAEWELYQELLPQISLAEFGEVAESWTQSGNTGLLVVRPEETESSSGTNLAAASLAQIEGARALQVDAYEDDVGDVPLLATIPTPGSITAEEQIESIDAVKWTLSNGITVIAKQTDFKNDEVVFRSFSSGGHSLASDDDHFSALHAAQLVSESGAGPHDSVTLDKLLAGIRVSVSPYIGELFEGFGGSASPEDMETLFQLITLHAAEPRIDPASFSNYESRLRSVAEFNAAEPDSVLFDTVNALLAQNHFRARPLSVELLEELSMERAEAVYADRFADLSDSTFVFVGAFDWDDLRSLTATYLASLPSTARAEQWHDHGIDPPPGLVDHAVYSGTEPRSNTLVLFAGDMEWSRQEALTLNVVGEVLGIRLRERVREQLGGTYSIGVSASGSSLPDPEYLAYVIFGSDPTRVEELFAEVIAEVDWLREGGEQSYLDTVKELLSTSRQEDLRDNGFWLGQIQSATQRGESFSEITGFDERLEAFDSGGSSGRS